MQQQGYRPAPLVPLKSPLELRDLTIRDYKRSHERIGMPIGTADVERLARNDLELVDAYQRGVDRSPPTKPREPKPKRQIITPQEDANLPKMKAAPKHRDRPNVLYGDVMKVSARWPYALGRIRRIVEGTSPSSKREVVVATAECPKLAMEVWELLANYQLRYRNSRMNPFRDLTDFDAQRKMQRMVEDICDRSSGKLGPWFVPK